MIDFTKIIVWTIIVMLVVLAIYWLAGMELAQKNSITLFEEREGLYNASISPKYIGPVFSYEDATAVAED